MLRAQHLLPRRQHRAFNLHRLCVLALQKERGAQVARGYQRVWVIRPEHALLHRQHCALNLLRFLVFAIATQRVGQGLRGREPLEVLLGAI